MNSLSGSLYGFLTITDRKSNFSVKCCKLELYIERSFLGELDFSNQHLNFEIIYLSAELYL